MAATLASLVDDVAERAGTTDDLALLATAASIALELTDSADALLTHYVDLARRQGRSWSEIGGSLNVTKQAVQKRFTPEQREPREWCRYTQKAQHVVSVGAPAAAAELGHNYVGTEHLLAGVWVEPESVASRVLTAANLSRDDVIAAIDAKVPRGQKGLGGFTPRAWIALENVPRIATQLGHSYVGTEHVLLSLVSGVGGFAEEILRERGVTAEDLSDLVTHALASPR